MFLPAMLIFWLRESFLPEKSNQMVIGFLWILLQPQPPFQIISVKY